MLSGSVTKLLSPSWLRTQPCSVVSAPALCEWHHFSAPGSRTGPANRSTTGTLEGRRKQRDLLLPVWLLSLQQPVMQAASTISVVFKDKPTTAGSNHQLLSVLPESTTSRPISSQLLWNQQHPHQIHGASPLHTQGCWELLPAATTAMLPQHSLLIFLLLQFNQFPILQSLFYVLFSGQSPNY